MILKNNRYLKNFNILKGLSLALFTSLIFIPHLIELNYHPLSVEVFFIFLISFIPIFFLGYLSNWNFYLIFSAFLSYWFLDSYFINDEKIFIITLIVVLIFFYIRTLDKTIFPLACILFSFLFVLFSLNNFKSEILTNEKLSTNIDQNNAKPNFSYLHIILDEHSSLNFFTKELKDTKFNKQFEEDYIVNKFKIYNNIFSESYKTRESLGAIFGLYDDENLDIRKKNFIKNDNNFTYSLKKNSLARKLKERNFKISFIQSNYFEICDKLRSYSCETYTRSANMDIFKKYNIDFIQRLKILILSLHQDYYFRGHKIFVYKKIIDFINKDKPRSYGYFSRPLANVQIFDTIKDRVKDLKKGEALIAHMFLPHYPYVLDENCNLKKIRNWNYPLRHNKNETKFSAYEGFLEQAKCTHKKIMPILNLASKKEDLIVVIHGDHAARLFLNTELENERDKIGTFIALKGFGYKPEVINKNFMLQEIFVKFFKNYFEE